MSRKKTPAVPRAPVWLVAVLLTGLAAPAWSQGIDQAIDSFFATTFGWFVNLIFYSVPIGEAQFPLIVGWLLIAAIIFTVYFGFPQLSRSSLRSIWCAVVTPTPRPSTPVR